MVNFINKAVWVLMNPVSFGIGLIILSLCLKKWKKTSRALAIVAVAWFYFWSTRFATWMVGMPLETDFLIDGRMANVETYPTVDAILDFGGGVGSCTNISEYAELYQSADRPYFAAKLWKAGKAPIIIPSNGDVVDCDVKFLNDLGVPTRAIVVENDAANTEENAKRVAAVLSRSCAKVDKSSVLLVTSAWHMKRSLLMMKKYAPDVQVIPAPCDFEATRETGKFGMAWFNPEPQLLADNSAFLHEWIGYWGYKLFR